MNIPSRFPRPRALAACLVLLFNHFAYAADDAAALLRSADRFRLAQDDVQVETAVTVFKRDGALDKERRYTVFAQTEHRSLVLMRSPVERGQKLLMLGDDFWLIMPDAQRPLRITPTQKLLGEASVGDIATLQWAQDYRASIVAEESCGEAAAARPCIHLTLHAERKGVTYRRIELWVGKRRGEPIRADLYLQSDKIAKQASFVVDVPDAPSKVTEMVLLDQLSNHKETRIRYLSRKPRQLPQTWLNPMALARNLPLD